MDRSAGKTLSAVLHRYSKARFSTVSENRFY